MLSTRPSTRPPHETGCAIVIAVTDFLFVNAILFPCRIPPYWNTAFDGPALGQGAAPALVVAPSIPPLSLRDPRHAVFPPRTSVTIESPSPAYGGRWDGARPSQLRPRAHHTATARVGRRGAWSQLQGDLPLAAQHRGVRAGCGFQSGPRTASPYGPIGCAGHHGGLSRGCQRRNPERRRHARARNARGGRTADDQSCVHQRPG